MDIFLSTKKKFPFLCELICCFLALLGSSKAKSNLTWIIQPSPQSVKTGRTVTFNCSAKYDHPLQYHWKVNDTVITDQSTDRSSRFTIRKISNGSQLVIPKTRFEDQGTYQCFVKSLKDNITFNGSDVAKLEVSEVVPTDSPITKETAIDGPSNFTWIRQPTSQTVEKGSTVIFSCLANCDKLISYHWKANNKTIDGDAESRYTIDTNGTLEIASTTEEDRGTYQCYVMTNDGQQKLGESATARLDIKDKSDEVKAMGSMWKTAGIAVGCAAGYVLVVVALMLYLERRKARKHNRRKSMPYLGHENLAVETDVEDGKATVSKCVAMNSAFRPEPTNDKLELEFPKHDLVEMMNLGNGSYGQAFLARASGIRDDENVTMVVVKCLRSKEDGVRQEFMKEIKALCGLKHSNVVSCLGVCTLEEPHYIILELMEKGDLKQFLLSRSHDEGKLDSNKKHVICAQVLAGMNYLSSKNFVHKDLAARNCMIGRDLKVKIGFLSLSCDLYSAEYYRLNNMQIPLRWMPPEAIFDGKFSEKSDVWSFGVLVWEIYTFGQMPYPDRSNEKVLEGIKDDLRPRRPDQCPVTVLEVLEKCWKGNPLDRPTFQELSDTTLL